MIMNIFLLSNRLVFTVELLSFLACESFLEEGGGGIVPGVFIIHVR